VSRLVGSHSCSSGHLQHNISPNHLHMCIGRAQSQFIPLHIIKTISYRPLAADISAEDALEPASTSLSDMQIEEVWLTSSMQAACTSWADNAVYLSRQRFGTERYMLQPPERLLPGCMGFFHFGGEVVRLLCLGVVITPSRWNLPREGKCTRAI